MDSKGREVWKQGAFSHYLAEEAGLQDWYQ